MGKFKTGCLGFIVIVVLLAIIGSCMGPSGGDKKSSDTGKSTKTEEKAPDYTCDVEGVGKVKGAIASDVGIAVYGIEEKMLLVTSFIRNKLRGNLLLYLL